MPVYVEDEFFALKLSANKTYSQEVEMPFRVTMAALDLTSMKKENENMRTSLVVRVDDVEYVLCNLSANKTEQQPLNVVFTPGEEVTFFASGSADAAIHLTGNFLSFENEFDEGFGETLGDYDTQDEDDEEDDSEFDSEMDDFIEYDEEGSEVDAAGASEKKSPKIKEISEEEGSDVEEAGSDVEIDDMMSASGSEQDSDDDSEDDSDDDSEGEDMELGSAAEMGSDADSDEEIDSDLADSADEDEQDSDDDDSSDDSDDEELKVSTKENDKKRAQASQTETPSKKAKNEPAAKPQEKAATGKVTTVNGVKIEEIAPGKGTRKVQDGNQVGILYTGTLSNGKVFDSNMKSGKPFTFKVGSGSVIKGFDIAVKGMTFNEVRKVTIPPHLAYGNKNLPGIPKNSTLTFEIKLAKF